MAEFKKLNALIKRNIADFVTHSLVEVTEAAARKDSWRGAKNYLSLAHVESLLSQKKELLRSIEKLSSLRFSQKILDSVVSGAEKEFMSLIQNTFGLDPLLLQAIVAAMEGDMATLTDTVNKLG